MANGYFERGEIYQVRTDDGFGCETGIFRPGLIVSADAGNKTSPTVLAAYLTTKDHRDRLNYETYATGRRSFVLCNQIITVDKRRLGNMMGVLNQTEMREVDDRLEEVFDLGYTDEEALKEKDREIENRDAVIAEKEKEIAELKTRIAAEVAKAESVEMSYKVENAMWQKLYEKALNQLVDMKYTNDLFLKDHLGREDKKPVEKEAPVVEEAPVVNDPPVEDDRLDINRCTITALKNVGFSLAVARQITIRRPFTSVADLKGIPGLKASLFRVMEPKLRCVPIEEEPKDVVVVKDEPDPGYEVDPPQIPEETDEEPKKINVNTASAKEIAEFLGISENQAMCITGKRKREGLFTSLEQIIHPKRFSAGTLEKYRDKLEI